jgi:YebC/PmpR family DNA-binding regulatory protein
MAGHSKWANIQHRKKRQDAKRGKMFTKHIRAITVAARSGADLSGNPRLRDAVEKAKVDNMSNDTIERAIKKGSGALEGQTMEEITYEGYGPSGVAVLVECLTDNRNRTVAEVRHAFAKCGGNLGTDGSVSYLFSKRGLLSFAAGYDENKLMSLAIDLGVLDVITNEDGSMDVITNPLDFNTIRDGMIAQGLQPELAEVTLIASVSVELNKEDAERMLRLQELLEDLDDVQQVYSNAEIPEAVLKELQPE